MKAYVPLLALLATVASAAGAPSAAIPWFTSAQVQNSIQSAAPDANVLTAPGAIAEGLRPDKAFAIENPLLSQANGYISLWIRPEWNGTDQKPHVLVRIGDPSVNGLLIEKSAGGMLRFVMASPAKTTAARTDVSHWKAGQWRHIVAAWITREGRPTGLSLWVDRKAVDGPIAGGNTFLDPTQLDDPSVWIGDETSECVFDELVFRQPRLEEEEHGLVGLVYRDYFQTAPYNAVQITHEALRTPSDRRVVAGFEKPFGLLAQREGVFEYVTDDVFKYGNWKYFDAKPFVSWSTSDESVATVNAEGRVKGVRPGRCTLTAQFHGLTDTYDLEVIPVEQPDLDLLFVQRLPRYRARAVKNAPAPGETVESVVYLENFGFTDVPAGAVVRLELIPDLNGDFELNDNERPIHKDDKTIARSLAPRERCTVSFEWTWPEQPVFVRVTLDPDNRVPEICEANNARCELNIARPMRWAIEGSITDRWHNERVICHVGSFSQYDWMNAHCDRMNLILRDSVGPTTTPHGVDDRIRSDQVFDLAGERDVSKTPFDLEADWYDGGFPILDAEDPMGIDSAILHEYGHTCLALPDLYGYPMRKGGVLLKDGNGQPYEGGPLMPYIRKDALPMPSGANDPIDMGYNSLMNYCHMWLHPAHAGQAQHFAGHRGDRFWGVQGRMIPAQKHLLQVFDLDDKPLVGAAVYVYQVINPDVQDAGCKYFADRPKYVGHTNEEGVFQIPERTHETWDDPSTDEVEGEYAMWNPFGRVEDRENPMSDIPFTPNVWSVEGLLLVKVCAGDQTELAWLCLTDFNVEYFSGELLRGIYPIRTSLRPTGAPTPLALPEIPEAIRTANLAPVAVAPEEIVVRVGEEFTLDGSRSSDPEGQPLEYRWKALTWNVQPHLGFEAVLKAKAPDKPGEEKYALFVIDGLRASKVAEVTIRVVDDEVGPIAKPSAK